MCTAAAYKTNCFYFGRTLDYDFSYGEQPVITPRGYDLRLNKKTKYAIIGMAYVYNDYPLYYDAVNEAGLCMAGLNFVGNAYYGNIDKQKTDVPQYRFIPYILSSCASTAEARQLLSGINITDEPFDKNLPAAQLHWIIADKTGAVTVECTRDGMKIYDNPVGVLTNNPPFNEQLFRLNDYMRLSPYQPINSFSDKLNLSAYSRGMGALGLPGDLSSPSRFVRAAFVKLNSISGSSEKESVNQFFHIMGAVEQQRGCCAVGDKYEITIYTSCCNADRGIYYYTTYNNHRINAINMRNEDLNGNELIKFSLVDDESINYVN